MNENNILLPYSSLVVACVAFLYIREENLPKDYLLLQMSYYVEY